MANVDGTAQVEMLDDCGDIGGIVVHVVPLADLARTAMAAPVMGDDTIALRDEGEHLRIPVVAAQGPAVMKDDRLTGAPVLVEDLNALLGGDRAHCCSVLGLGEKKNEPALWPSGLRSHLEINYTPPRRHQVGCVRMLARAASALRVVVGVVNVALRSR